MLLKTLQSLSEMSVPVGLHWELIVADNNSTDGTAEIVRKAQREFSLPIEYIFEPRQGKSYALNTAMQRAKGGVLAFTDDDVIVDRNWLREINDALDRHDCAGVGGKIVPIWECVRPPWLILEGPYKLNAAIVNLDLGDTALAITMKTLPFGANLALRRTAIEKYGEFRTDLGPRARILIVGEETEYCRRLLRNGEKLIYVPDAIVYHPVEKIRTQKVYFQRWYFGFGRGVIREWGIPQGAVRYFGVPRFLLRGLAEKALRWAFTLNSTRRFYHKLQVWQVLGEIYEARQASKRSSRDSGAPETGAG
jgi:GT2 family glycosyltransferase